MEGQGPQSSKTSLSLAPASLELAHHRTTSSGSDSSFRRRRFGLPKLSIFTSRKHSLSSASSSIAQQTAPISCTPLTISPSPNSNSVNSSHPVPSSSKSRPQSSKTPRSISPILTDPTSLHRSKYYRSLPTLNTVKETFHVEKYETELLSSDTLASCCTSVSTPSLNSSVNSNATLSCSASSYHCVSSSMGSLSNSYGSANSISLASSVASSFSATFSSSVSPSFSPITPLSPTTPISPTSTTQVINQYIVLNEIGSGSYGKVYLVKNTQDNRYYACKIISKTKLRRQWRWKGLSNSDPDYMAGVKTEIAVLKKLSHHPNITTLVEVLDDTREENLYMVFELCQQGPIMSLKLGETVPFYTETQARKYFRDVLLGAEFLHFNRIIHQDLKPDNILLTADGSAQIADFGVSQICENEDDSLQSKTGSPAFSPPEAISAGSKHVKGKALDIWSLGVTLYCLVHGHVPFEDTDILSLYDRISTCSPPISPSLSPALVDLITKMLTKDPEQRITLDKIKIHPWITNFGAEEMMSTEENCVFEDVTEKEVEDAVSPAVSFLSKFMKIMGKKSRRRSASPSTGQRSYF